MEESKKVEIIEDAKVVDNNIFKKIFLDDNESIDYDNAIDVDSTFSKEEPKMFEEKIKEEKHQNIFTKISCAFSKFLKHFKKRG